MGGFPKELKTYTPHKELPLEQFIELYPHPFIVITERPHREGGRTLFDTIGGELQGGSTISLIPERKRIKLDDHLVYELRKAEGSLILTEIYAGRTPNNDIVLLSNAVSKVHFALKPELKDTSDRRRHLIIPPTDDLEARAIAKDTYLSGQGDTWQIRDNNSSNGTLLHGVKLTPNEPTPIRNGDQLGIAGYAGTFFLPHGFHEYLNNQ